MTRPWHDVDQLGRETRAMMRQMNDKFWKYDKENNPDLAHAYYDRYMKGLHELMPLVEIITGVKKFIKEGKKLEDPLSI